MLRISSTSLLTLLLACGFTMEALFAGQEPGASLPDLLSFLQEVRKYLRSDDALLSQYTFIEKTSERRLDKEGNVKKTEVRVYELYPSLEGGRPYRKLISKNGRPVPPEEREKQEREFEKKAQERVRKLEREGAKGQERHQAREAEERRKEERAIDELFKLYEIAMVGRDAIDGHPTIQLSFRPRPDFKPTTDGGKVLKKVAGRAWVSESEYQLVRVEAELIDTWSFGFGVLARLNKGATAVFQRRKVNHEVWLPAEAHFSGKARLLLLKGLTIDAASEFSDYRKFAVATSISYPTEKSPQ